MLHLLPMCFHFVFGWFCWVKRGSGVHNSSVTYLAALVKENLNYIIERKQASTHFKNSWHQMKSFYSYFSFREASFNYARALLFLTSKSYAHSTAFLENQILQTSLPSILFCGLQLLSQHLQTKLWNLMFHTDWYIVGASKCIFCLCVTHFSWVVHATPSALTIVQICTYSKTLFF